MRASRRRLTLAAVLAGACVTPAASAAHAGGFARFDECPSREPGVLKCVRIVTSAGAVRLGRLNAQITHPVTLQGGVSGTDEAHDYLSTFYAASGGNTLTRAPQPVPGGLSSVFRPTTTPPWLRMILGYVVAHGPVGVGATLELAGSATAIRASEYHLLAEEGTALRLPIRIHLENPILGSDCYVGSSARPIAWNLSSGAAAGLFGTSGTLHAERGGEIVTISGTRLVDDAWAAPGASGCGGVLAPLVDPVIDRSLGLPAAAGASSALLESVTAVANVASVNAR